MNPRHPSVFSLLLIAAASGWVCVLACGSTAPSKEGQPCSVYATDTACAKSLLCECETAGCFCVPSCNPAGDAGCRTGAQCLAGVRPAEGQTGYFCFSPDGGS